MQRLPSLGFSSEVIGRFKSYPRSKKFQVSVHDKFSTTAELRWGVPQYMNDMRQTKDCDLFLYADDTCLLYQHKDLDQINKELTKIFVTYVTGLSITSWAFTLGTIKLNLSFSLPKTKRRKFEH